MATQEVELPLTPTTLLTRCAAQPGAFLLDGGDERSWGLGHAVLGFRPRAKLRVYGDGTAEVHGIEIERSPADPFELLERFCHRCRASLVAPGRGAAVVAALGYDLRRWVERLPARAAVDRTLPVLHAAFYDWLLWYSYPGGPYQLEGSSAELRAIAGQLTELAAGAPARWAGAPRVRCDLRPAQYCDAVATALRYIAAGDVYQVNLAQRFVVDHGPPPAALFAALQRHAVPFAAYVDAGDFVLVSNSPECWLTLHDGVVATFPIKGTRPRAEDRRHDLSLLHELQRSPKERAEHVMIVDLERNDLGRICRTGSVRVDRFAEVASFPTLHHLVSRISGELCPETRFADVLRATFPGGSITGAPKIRAMEIIDEVEPVDRGFYTGAIGFIRLDGDAVFNLAIRTAVATPDALTYYAGGGIVADSMAQSEYEETLLKAQPFFRALCVAATP